MSFKDKILNNQSPWGSPPPGGDGGRGSSDGNGSGSRQDPPSIDDLIRNFQKSNYFHFKNYLIFYLKNIKLKKTLFLVIQTYLLVEKKIQVKNFHGKYWPKTN